MATTVNWLTGEISIPRADMPVIQVSPEVRQLDTAQLWLDLKDLEKSVDGIIWPDTQSNNPSYVISGFTYAQAFQIIPPYFITFEDGQYSVALTGTNNNIIDVATANQVRILSQNSGGLIGNPQIEEMHGQVQREVWIDTTAVTNGNGYQQSPYNNWTDAVDYAEANGILGLVLIGDATVDRQIKNFQIRGIGEPTIDVNGQILEKCRITDCQFSGSFGGTNENSFWHCYFLNGVTGVTGDLHDCGFGGVVSFLSGGSSTIIDGYSLIAGLSRPTIDVGGGGCAVSIRDYRGGLVLAGADNAADEVTVSLAMGRLRLDATNTAGTISCRGICDFEDLSAGSTVETSGLVDDIIFNRLIETGYSFEQIVRILSAHAAGDVDEPVDGTYAIRDINDTKDRITGTQTVNGGRNVTSVDGT